MTKVCNIFPSFRDYLTQGKRDVKKDDRESEDTLREKGWWFKEVLIHDSIPFYHPPCTHPEPSDCMQGQKQGEGGNES